MPLFHPRIIEQITANAPESIPEGHAQIVSDWAATIENRSIHQQTEVAVHGHFTQRILIDVLGYVGFGNQDEWTLQPEQQIGSGAVDVALGRFANGQADVIAPFELKPAKMRDLDAVMPGRNKTPVQQAWEYAMDAPGARWVLVSNYLEVRLYAVGYGRALYETWKLRDLVRAEEFAKFYALLCAENLLGGYTLQLLQESENVQEEITNALYGDYRELRTRLFFHIRENHPEKSTRRILKLAQTILDRVLFIAFAEDTGLLPPNTLERTYAQHNPFAPVPIWQNFLGLFQAIDVGRVLEVDGATVEIPAYNGGLFREEHEIGELEISDQLCDAFKAIGRYEFQSEVSVEVLGHILEQSITDLEELTAAAEDEDFDDRLSRRRTEGVYYTPSYVTRHMIEETVGQILATRKAELGQDALPDLTDDDYQSIKLIQRGPNRGQVRYNNNIASHVEFWTNYRDALAAIRIVDPACGSGAFLIAAYDFLLSEGELVNAEISNLVAGQQELFRWDTHILQNNLFGVDINSESIEITKLSLWLKTANPREPLTYLDDNIRVGNSVIDNAEHAPNDALNWQTIGDGEFDVVVANPPYVSMLELSRHVTPETKRYWKSRFVAATGAYDLFVLFMELSIEITREGGYIALITPNKYLAAPYGVGIRTLIRGRTHLCNVLDLTRDGVFQDPSVYPIVSILHRTENTDEPTSYSVRDTETGRVEVKRELPALGLDALPDQMFSLIMSEYSDELTNVLQHCSRLTDIAEVNATSTAGEADMLSDNIGENTEGGTILINTGTIDRYIQNWGISTLRAKGSTYTYPTINLGDVELSAHRRRIYAAPKLIFAKMALRPEVSLDHDGNQCSINTNCVFEPTVAIEYLQGVLNSKAMAFIYDQFFGSLRMSGGYLQFQSPQLRALPIPNAPESLVESIVGHVRRMNQHANEMLDLKRRFIGLLIQDFGLTGTTKRLAKFETLTWQVFANEIAENGVVLRGDAREDWLERFQTRSARINELMAEMAIVDSQIDQLVNTAFEFSPETIAVIESTIPADFQ